MSLEDDLLTQRVHRAEFATRIELTMRATGDEEAHGMDQDYPRAMSYGMPPTGAVILFPLPRPEGEIGIAARWRHADV